MKRAELPTNGNQALRQTQYALALDLRIGEEAAEVAAESSVISSQ